MMLFSFAVIFLCGMIFGNLFEKMHLPRLLGMLIAGILLGPSAFDLLDQNILLISADLRQIALIIILTQAGLNLNVSDLKKVGRPAFFLCFLPALFEITGFLFLAPKLFHLSLLESAILGSVIAAVSPAIIVPKMLKIMEEGFGKEKSIPQMILAGASVDDVFVIVLFTSFLNLAEGNSISVFDYAQIPLSILFGLGGGMISGIFLTEFFKQIHIRDSAKVIILLSVSFLLVTLEHALSEFIGFSGLLAVMGLSITLQKRRKEVALRLSVKYAKLWIGAELLLFVLVGATVNIQYAVNAGFLAALLLFGALLFRMAGVFFCLLGTNLNKKERLFCIIAYSPKATVQAAIGSIPLSMGLPCGTIVLTVAVLSILITAPLGSFLIDLTYQNFLKEK